MDYFFPEKCSSFISGNCPIKFSSHSTHGSDFINDAGKTELR